MFAVARLNAPLSYCIMPEVMLFRYSTSCKLSIKKRGGEFFICHLLRWLHANLMKHQPNQGMWMCLLLAEEGPKCQGSGSRAARHGTAEQEHMETQAAPACWGTHGVGAGRQTWSQSLSAGCPQGSHVGGRQASGRENWLMAVSFWRPLFPNVLNMGLNHQHFWSTHRSCIQARSLVITLWEIPHSLISDGRGPASSINTALLSLFQIKNVPREDLYLSLVGSSRGHQFLLWATGGNALLCLC